MSSSTIIRGAFGDRSKLSCRTTKAAFGSPSAWPLAHVVKTTIVVSGPGPVERFAALRPLLFSMQYPQDFDPGASCANPIDDNEWG